MNKIKFGFENFGFIKNGDIELEDLTVICGANNTGKSYIGYAIYCLLNDIKSLIDLNIDKYQLVKDFKEKKSIILNMLEIEGRIQTEDIGHNFTKNLSDYFNTTNYFDKSIIKFSFDDSIKPIKNFSGEIKLNKNTVFFEGLYDQNLLKIYTLDNDSIHEQLIIRIISDLIIKYLYQGKIPNSFMITSERNGASLFYKELDANKNNFFEIMSKNDGKLDPIELLKMRSRYAEPIQDNIDTIRDHEEIRKQKSFIVKQSELNNNNKYIKVLENLNEILGGSFKLTKDKDIIYVPNRKGLQKIKVPLHLTASATKSLFLIDLYIRHIAKPNSLLIIDEPELHLSTENQRKMAALITSLVNVGVKCLITTHSDYLIREINNRIMLSSNINNKEQFLLKYNIDPIEILNITKVNGFEITENRFIKKLDKSIYGINFETMEKTITDGNDLANDIFNSIEDEV